MKVYGGPLRPTVFISEQLYRGETPFKMPSSAHWSTVNKPVTVWVINSNALKSNAPVSLFTPTASITQPIRLKVSWHSYDGKVIQESHQSAPVLPAVTHIVFRKCLNIVLNIFFGLNPGSKKLFMIVLLEQRTTAMLANWGKKSKRYQNVDTGEIMAWW